jgi:hypothetical protein
MRDNHSSVSAGCGISPGADRNAANAALAKREGWDQTGGPSHSADVPTPGVNLGRVPGRV